VLLAIPLKTLPVFGRVAGYMDNILLMAKSENEGVAMSKALCGALKSNSAGPLRPKVRNFFGRPIDFLGHRLTVIGNKTKYDPTDDGHRYSPSRATIKLPSRGASHSRSLRIH
jgi:hypothetical protein